MSLGPGQDLLHSFCELEVVFSNEGLGVTWNVQSVEMLELSGDLLRRLAEVNWDHSGSCALQELNMSDLDELVLGENVLKVQVSLGLGENLELILSESLELLLP